MSLSNYSDLQTALGNWLDHSLYSARYGDFVTLFEATANRRLRVTCDGNDHQSWSRPPLHRSR